MTDSSFDYDLFVIGGGSGGLACAQEASNVEGVRVAVADFVKPSPQGTTWNIGGTCVNVGCIPKKLMHQAGMLGEAWADQKLAGWDVKEKPTHSWEKMLTTVNNHIRSLNFGDESSLIEKNVKYFNKYAEFVDPHTISLTSADGKSETVTAKHIVLACGGRPVFPDIEGAKEHCITSDDIFWRTKAPGKTLVVGASYVALECAGFLNSLGYDTTVMVRSILLRGFDQDMAKFIGEDMGNMGIEFIEECTPKSIHKLDNGNLSVQYSQGGLTVCGEYETVLLAIGRRVTTEDCGVGVIGIEVERNGKINTNDDDSVIAHSHIFAIGDIANRGLELTPVAIAQGRLLAKRLFKGTERLMNYKTIPTTVFTPLEYGTIGWIESDAIEKFGDENIEIFHTFFQPLEWTFNEHFKEKRNCYIKVICRIDEDMKVIGFHILCPNAGEITQGIAAAIHVGITKELLDEVVGIHPTIAEEMRGLTITKRENANPQKSAC